MEGGNRGPLSKCRPGPDPGTPDLRVPWRGVVARGVLAWNQTRLSKWWGFLLLAGLVTNLSAGCAPRRFSEPPPIVVATGGDLWVIRRVPTETPAPSLQAGKSGTSVLRETVVILMCIPEDPPVCKVAQVRGTWEEAVWPYMKLGVK